MEDIDDHIVELAKESFAEFDKHGRGRIAQNELTAVLRCMGQNPTDSEVNDMLNEVEVDVEGSGVIEFEQFVKFIARLNSKEGDLEEEAQYAFNRFDTERTGKILV